MTRDRFEALAEAFGGDVARWPAADRDAAAELMAQDPGFARRILAKASELDALLAQSQPAAASADLVGRIVAEAPGPRPRRAWGGWLLPAGLSAGLAAAGVAGLLVGAQLYDRSASQSDPVVAGLTDEGFSLYLEEDA